MTNPTQSPTSPLLKVRDLNISITGAGSHSEPVSIVDSVNFDVHAGEVFGVAGESGSGKSITALSLMGLLPTGGAATGSVSLEGREILNLAEAGWRKVRGNQIGMIFQDPLTSLHPMMTIGSQITEHAIKHGVIGRREAPAYAMEMLTKVRIPDAKSAAKAYPHQFSGGMRQRVAIAIALAARPKLLIADEPTTALDVTVQAGVLRLLRELCDESGMSVLIITHDLGVMSSLAERLAVFYAGRIVEIGSTKAVLREPRHPYTRGLLDALPGGGNERGAFVAIPGSPPRPGARPAGCRFEPRCPYSIEACRTSQPELISIGHRAQACFVDPWGPSHRVDPLVEKVDPLVEKKEMR